jgi:hypothetical protein
MDDTQSTMNPTQVKLRKIIIANAISSGSLGVIKFLGIDKDEASSSLAMAVHSNQTSIVEYLLTNFNITVASHVALVACQNNNIEIVMLLRNNGCPVPCIFADVVVMYCDLVMFKALFSEELHVDNRSAVIATACSCGKLDILQFIESQHSADIGEALVHGALHNQIDIVKYVSQSSSTYATEAYLIAAQQGHVDIVNHLKSFVSDEVINSMAQR